VAEDLGKLYYRVEADTSQLTKAERDMDGFGTGARKAEKDVDGLHTGTKKLGGGMDGAAKAIRFAAGALAALGATIGAREIIAYSDAWTNASNQLRQVTKGAAELTQVQGKLLGVSNDTRSSFESTANLYSRLARATTEMGLSQTELIGITTTINKSFAASGATATEAAAAITQLSQGLASGALRGDEFNSVAEQAPGIMRAIAASLKMTVGDLRAFAAEGGITADIVVTALKEASDTIAGDFAKANITFGQSVTVAKNNVTAFIGQSELIGGAVGSASSLVIKLSENIETIGTVAGVAATVMAARLIPAIAQSAATMLSATTAAGALSAAMALIGGPVGVAVIASVGVYKLVSAYIEHNKESDRAAAVAMLVKGGFYDLGEELSHTLKS